MTYMTNLAGLELHMKSKILAIVAAVLGVLMAVACAPVGGSEKTTPEVGVAAPADTDEADTPDVYKFGDTIKFKDGSTLTVGKPVKFKRDQYAAGGENKKVFLKFKSTFTNKTKEVFDPGLTSGSASSGGTEAESIYQDGLDAPDNKVLPGKSVTWWMGFGFDTDKDVQLDITVGFLNYGTVVFTS